MPAEVEIGNVPAKEAIAHLRQKLKIQTQHWDDIRGQIHARAFTVAGATKTELLSDLHRSVIDAIEQGQSIGDFRKSFDRIVQEHGWAYKGKRGWRTRVIYDTNMRTAHMAGRWDQIERTKRTRPYMRYLTVGDRRVRPEHQAWHGMVLAVDDPWWDSHYPPNGWGCRCSVQTLSERQVQAKGLNVEEGPEIERTERINVRSGEIYGDVPKGLDVGWDYNVGKAWLGPDIAFGQALAQLAPSLRRHALSRTNVRDYAKNIDGDHRIWARKALKDSKAAGGEKTFGFITDDVMTWLETSKDIRLSTATMTITGGELRHAAQLRKGKRGLPDDILLNLPLAVADRRAVLWDKTHDNLVYVVDISRNKKDPKLVIGINFKRKGQLVNRVVTGALVESFNLKDGNIYERVVGEL